MLNTQESPSVPNFLADLRVSSAPALDFFIPERGTNRDRFGNRLYAFSSELAYLDRSKRAQRASLLVSPTGQKFITQYPGILADIDSSLRKFAVGRIAIDKHTERDSYMVSGESGGQSQVYYLTVAPDIYVIKRRMTGLEYVYAYDPRQPYVNEMLQTQALDRDTGDELRKLGVVLPTILFASSHVICSQFVSGHEPTVNELYPIWEALPQITKKYIETQQAQENHLWTNVNPDIRPENFIKQPDGQLVWIDPFEYFPNSIKVRL